MTYIIAFLLSVITTLVALIAYFGRSFLTWAKLKIDEHIKGEDEFRKYVKDEIEKVNNSMDFFLRDLKPVLDNVEKIPVIEKKVEGIELDIKQIKKHVNL